MKLSKKLLTLALGLSVIIPATSLISSTSYAAPSKTSSKKSSKAAPAQTKLSKQQIANLNKAVNANKNAVWPIISTNGSGYASVVHLSVPQGGNQLLLLATTAKLIDDSSEIRVKDPATMTEYKAIYYGSNSEHDSGLVGVIVPEGKYPVLQFPEVLAPKSADAKEATPKELVDYYNKNKAVATLTYQLDKKKVPQVVTVAGLVEKVNNSTATGEPLPVTLTLQSSVLKGSEPGSPIFNEKGEFAGMYVKEVVYYKSLTKNKEGKVIDSDLATDKNTYVSSFILTQDYSALISNYQTTGVVFGFIGQEVKIPKDFTSKFYNSKQETGVKVNTLTSPQVNYFGLKAGDIIYRIDQNDNGYLPIFNPDRLGYLVANSKFTPGAAYRIHYIRDGKAESTFFIYP